MFDCSDVPGGDGTNDPRVDDRYLRCVDRRAGLGSVLLVGVVHDHPASTFRVTSLLGGLTPEILALELPAVAVPLFRLYADDVYTPPRMGGEMSAALQATDAGRVVGVDGPNLAYARLLLGRLVRDRMPTDVALTVLKDLVSGSLHALACRLGSVFGRLTGIRLRVYSHIGYESTLLDEPAVQADHENAHVAQHQSFLRAIETPPAMGFIDAAREESMARRLHDLRSEGDVVAVVGVEHVDPLGERLDELAGGP